MSHEAADLMSMTPALPALPQRLALYTAHAPRDAVNSQSNQTRNHSCWPKPMYVPPVVQRYRPSGSARDGWINSQSSETQGLHFVSDTELYWKSKLGQPEYRGKNKSAICSSADRYILYPQLKRVHNHPLVPRAAQMAERVNAMPPVKRTVFSGRWREVDEKNNSAKCDSLLESLKAQQQQQVPSRRESKTAR